MNLDYLNHYYKKTLGSTPLVHIVLGSGLASALPEQDRVHHRTPLAELPFSEIPGGRSTTVAGHSGRYRFYRFPRGHVVCFQVGRLHGYEGIAPWDCVQTVVAPALAGVPRFILSNAAGSLNASFLPGSVMLIRDHVNLTGTSPLFGPNRLDSKGVELGPRFPDQTRVWNEDLNRSLESYFQKWKVPNAHGVYLGLIGPTYETPAEVTLFQRWGLDAVGMSTVWEAIALNYLKKTVGGFSFISNLGAGISKNPLSHREVEEIAASSGADIINALWNYCEDLT